MKATAMNPTDADRALRQNKLFNVLVHGSVMFLSLLILHRILPWVVELSGFRSGKLPGSFQFVFDWQEIFEKRPILTVLGFLMLLWFDGRLYATFHRRFGRRAAQSWFFGVFIIMIAALAFCLWASHAFLTGMIQFRSHFL